MSDGGSAHSQRCHGSLTAAYQLLPLIRQVRGHLTVAHELLEAQKVEAARPQTEKGGTGVSPQGGRGAEADR